MQLRATAFIAVRNGAAYVERCVRYLVANGLSLVLIDNASTDATPELIERLQHRGLVKDWITQPYAGYFDLETQLALKRRLITACTSEWVLHLDIDEMPHSPHADETLLQAMLRAEAAGCNALNFEEFVFLPLEADYQSGGSGFPYLRHYYFFEPAPRRLMRAWRRDLQVSNLDYGGHRLQGKGIRSFPENMVLRHYPFLSQNHALTKYPSRRFSPQDLARGWHGNRLHQPSERFVFPPAAELECLEAVDCPVLNRSRPR